MANAAIEETSDEELEASPAAQSGISARSSLGLESSLAELGAYGEEDDAATQLVEPLHSEPRWLVQITPFDRRSMETTALVSDVLAGRLAPSTPVWRDGMQNWTPLDRVLDLPIRSSAVRQATSTDGAAPPDRSRPRAGVASRALASLPGAAGAFAAASRSAALAGPVFWLVNAAVALAVAAATLGVLTAGGVFD
jgi:hypothetical protein